MKFIVGDYPKEYKPEVHGPYDPARYYGKPDTPFDQVKLKDLRSWFGRRNYHPLAMVQAWSRMIWRWNHKYCFSKNFSGVYIMQVSVWGQIIYFTMNSYKQAAHIQAKYH